MSETNGGRRNGHGWLARSAGAFLALVAVGAALAACDASGQTPSATATATVRSTPTATVTPQTLYQADWSHGADGWNLPSAWRVSGGALVNDGSGTAPEMIPLTVTSPKYTLTFQIQVQGITPAVGMSSEYGVIAQDEQGHPLYYAVLSSLDPLPPHHGFSELIIPNAVSTRTQDFVPGSILRTFVVQVREDEISFLIDGSGLGSLVSPVSLVPSRLVFVDRYVQLMVASVTITTP